MGGSTEGTPRGGIEGMGRQTGEATRLTVTRQTSSRDHGQPFLSITGKMSLNLAFIERERVLLQSHAMVTVHLLIKEKHSSYHLKCFPAELGELKSQHHFDHLKAIVSVNLMNV